MSKEDKADLINQATKANMNLSEYIMQSIQEKMSIEKLSESQSQFLKLFEIAFHESYDNLHKQIMLILNRNNFNSECLLLQQEIFMKNVKVPQKREDLIMPKFINHPITDMAKEMVLKDIRKLSKNKHEAIIDE